MPFDFDTEAAKFAPGTEDKEPDGRVDKLIIDSERAYSAANPERSAFLTVKDLDIDAIDFMPSMITALRTSQNDVGHASDQKADASMRPVYEESTALISTVSSRARYFFRNDKNALRELDRIGQTGAIDDRHGDLHRLAAFIGAHPDLLADNPDIPANAAERAVELATMLATQDGSAASKAAIVHRNVAYWMLSKALSDVRAAARYRFAGQKHKEQVIEKICGSLVAPKRKAKGEQSSDAPASTGNTDGVTE